MWLMSGFFVWENRFVLFVEDKSIDSLLVYCENNLRDIWLQKGIRKRNEK